MTNIHKPDLRDQTGKPGATVRNLDEKFAGAENRNIMPKDGAKLVTPDPGNTVPGQGAKSN